MGRVCCVMGCPSGGDAPSHQIPKNPILFQKWKSKIYSEKIQHLTDEQISKCAVCYRHFAEDDYLVTFRVRKLKRGIAPSLNLSNNPTTNNCKSNVIKIEPETQKLDICTSISAAKVETVKNKEIIMEVPEKNVIALFEDIPEETEFYLSKQSELTLLDKHMKQANSVAKVSKLCCKKRALKRKQTKLTKDQLIFLSHKKQAERYEKTPTIQKLLSLLTPDEIAAIKNKIRKSKYLPRVYVRIYHDIAKKKILGEV